MTDEEMTTPMTGTTDEAPDGAEILDGIHAFIGRFMVMPSDAALDAVALWAMHCHCTDKERVLVFDSTPRLAILSDEPGSAKTLLMTLLELLTPRALIISQPTAPALVNLIRDEHATILLDELDLFFGPGNGRRDARALINTGYKRSGKTARANGVIHTFAPFCIGGLAAVFCANENLRPTRERCIMIRLRKIEGEREEFRSRLHDAIGHDLREAASAWATAYGMELATAWPDLPDGVDGRTKEIWEPLFAVAEIAGGDWPKRADAACRALALGDGSDARPELTPLARLLRCLRAAFDGEAEVGSAELVRRLYALDKRFLVLWPNEGLAPRELAALLRPLGVAPRKFRPEGGAPVQGYRLADLEQYLASDVPAVPAVPMDNDD